MADVSIHRADELAPATKAVVEAELGRPLRADEQVSIMAFSQHEHPAGEARQEAAQKLREHFQDIDPRTEAVPTEEMEEVLNEALRSARPGYRERE